MGSSIILARPIAYCHVHQGPGNIPTLLDSKKENIVTPMIKTIKEIVLNMWIVEATITGVCLLWNLDVYKNQNATSIQLKIYPSMGLKTDKILICRVCCIHLKYQHAIQGKISFVIQK
jgi:hypothetical protein